MGKPYSGSPRCGPVAPVANYPLHYLQSDETFEDLVCDVCRVLLGDGVTKFAPGKDGGRDCKFVGKANCFPSKTEPLNGRTIVQAKWTHAETASCSDADFKRLLIQDEAPKAAKLVQAGELNHWLIFTNRRKTAGADAALEKELLALTKAQSVYLRGVEDISGFLDGQAGLVKKYRLHQFTEPLRINPESLRDIVVLIHGKWSAASKDSSFNFANYHGIDKKNEANQLNLEYFKFIKERSEPYFATIKAFLENPRNTKVVQSYHAVADDFQHKIIVRRKNYGDFAEVVDALFEELVRESTDFSTAEKRQLMRVVLHYMYCNCDIGTKP